MTLNPRTSPAFPIPPIPAPQMVRPVRPSTELFGVLVLEAVMPVGNSALPILPDWDIRVWPVARLGDVTLEAQPLAAPPQPGQSARRTPGRGLDAAGAGAVASGLRPREMFSPLPRLRGEVFFNSPAINFACEPDHRKKLGNFGFRPPIKK